MVVRIALVTLALLGACALLAEKPPANTCKRDEDCFRAQGEVCNLDTHRCEPGPDGGVPVDAPGD